ncbi:hypothetical protein N184_25880 [Sinorhizobium sp. GL28]|nr:hypothetical protein N184_25880 [Sinorhizobium sp. GL28]
MVNSARTQGRMKKGRTRLKSRSALSTGSRESGKSPAADAAQRETTRSMPGKAMKTKAAQMVSAPATAMG